MNQENIQPKQTNHVKLGITIIVSLIVVGLLGYGGYLLLQTKQEFNEDVGRDLDQFRVSTLELVQTKLASYAFDNDEGWKYPASIDEIEIKDRNAPYLQTLVYGTSPDRTEYVLGVDLADGSHSLLIGNDGYYHGVNCQRPTYCVIGNEEKDVQILFGD